MRISISRLICISACQKESVNLGWWWARYNRLNGVVFAKIVYFLQVVFGRKWGRAFLDRFQIFTTSRGPLCLGYVRILSIMRKMVHIPRWSSILTWCTHVRTLECLSISNHLPSDFLFLFITQSGESSPYFHNQTNIRWAVHAEICMLA